MKQPPKITVSMIVKNEEKYLRECLESVKGVADEIVIVDTGSTDNTKNIAGEFGAAIYNYEWINNFSEARNYALSKSAGDWILYLDADERLSADSIHELKNISVTNDLTGFRCLVNNIDEVNGMPKFMRYTRLFRNSQGIKFTGRVHEQIDDSLIENGYQLKNAGIEIIHIGYNIPAEGVKKKAERNLSLLKEEREKNGTAYNAYQLANSYSILEEHEAANSFYLMSVEDGNLNREYKAHAYLNLSGYEFKRHNTEKAIEYLDKGMQSDASLPLLNLLAADIFFRLNKKDESLEYCKKAFLENKKITCGRNESALAIGLKPEAILSKGIYYALLAADNNKLNYFLSELNKENVRLHVLMNKLIKNNTISAAEKKEIADLMSADNIDVFLVLIESYRDKQSALEILKAVKNSFNNNSKFLKTLGLLYFENNLYDEAVRVFEESLALGEKDPASVFYLISVLIQNNQLEKIPDLLLLAEKEFGNIPEFNSKLEILKRKLGVLFNN